MYRWTHSLLKNVRKTLCHKFISVKINNLLFTFSRRTFLYLFLKNNTRPPSLSTLLPAPPLHTNSFPLPPSPPLHPSGLVLLNALLITYMIQGVPKKMGIQCRV